RRIGDDEATQPRTKGLVVVDQPAIVADQRVRHHDDLPGVRRIGADLLVARLAGVDDEIAAGSNRRAEGDTGKDGAVLEGEECRPEVTDPWIDDGARPGLRRDDHAGTAGSGLRFRK